MTDESQGLLIALSAGGIDAELAAHGGGVERVEELMVQISMNLLRDGHRLSFGGTLGAADRPLTKTLIDTAQNWLDEASAKSINVNLPATWPLLNYSAWPYYLSITEEQRSRLAGICEFVDIDPPHIGSVELKPLAENWKNSPKARRCVADALSAMRDRSAKEADLRVVWGGRIKGADGWMAGILEEVLFALRYTKPVLIFGGFGGCARLLADFLHSEKKAWPDELSLASCADAERDALMKEAERRSLNERMAEAQERLTEFRAALYSRSTVNGVSCQLIRAALLNDNARIVINTIEEAGKQLKHKTQ